jgi:hypothetical protein
VLKRLTRTLPFAAIAVGILSAFFASSAIASSRTTEKATEVDATVANLNGAISAEGHKTDYDFSYGTSSDPSTWAHYTAVKTTESKTAIQVHGRIKGLEPGTTYYFGLVTHDYATGEYKAGSTLSFTTLSSSHPTQFLATDYPVTISGLGKQEEVLRAANIHIRCGATLYYSSLSAAASTLTVAPEFSSCSSEMGATSVKFNSCRYKFNVDDVAPYEFGDEQQNFLGSAAISCTKEGDAIEFVNNYCTFKVAAQAPSSWLVGYENQGPPSSPTLWGNGWTNNLKWTSGAGTLANWCGLAEIPASGEGWTTINALLKAVNSKGAQTELYVSKG